MVSSAHLGSQARTAQQAISQVEARRRLVVNIVFLIYVLALIEGPLRKWFLPQLSTPLIFLRDPVVIALYVYCFACGIVAHGRLARNWLVFAGLASAWGALPYFVDGVSEIGWALGIRSYWLYMPLAFVIAANFRREDVVRFLYLSALIAIPYAFLMAVQYNAGPSARINHGIAGDDDAAIGLGGNIVRPFGLFTYSGQNTRFVAAVLAMFVALYLARARIRFRVMVLMGGTVAVGAMCVLTGSRSIYFLAAAILGLTIIGSTIARPNFGTLMRNVGLLALVALAAYLFVNQFPDMLAAMERRFEVAERSEGSIWDRALGGVFGFVEPMSTAPFLGHGIGVGAPGVAQFLGLSTLLQGEGDLERNVNELGLVFGPLLVLMRFGTAAWLALASVRLARRGNLSALPLAGYTAVEISIGQITNSPLSAFMPWVVAGLTMALINSGRERRTKGPFCRSYNN